MIHRRSKPRSKRKSLKNKLWDIFSKYIRQRDKGVCISCGKSDDWKNMDAGHYIPKTAGLSIYFHEKNVHAQCTGCNRFRHGNLSQYALALQRKYGGDILSLLDAARRTQRKIKEYEYEQLIEHYKAKLAEIEEARGMCEAADAEMRENPREETKDTAA